MMEGVSGNRAVSLDPASAWRAKLEAWSEEGDLETLHTALKAESSLVIRAVISRRIRALNNQKVAPLHYQEQNFGPELEAELQEAPGQGKALFAEGSVLKDGLLYASMKQAEPFETKTVYDFYPDVSSYLKGSHLDDWPLELDGESAHGPDLTPTQTSFWDKKLRQWASSKIRCKEGFLSKHDILNNIKRRRGSMNGSLKPEMTPERVESLVEWIWGHSTSGQVLPTQQKQKAKNAQFSYHLYADVAECDESALLDHLASEATVTPNPFVVPAYYSWADIDPGKRFTIELPEGGKLHYVPHRSVGKTKSFEFEHTLTLPQTSEAEIELEIKEIRQTFSKHNVPLDQMLICEAEYLNNPSHNAPRLVFPSRSKHGARMRKLSENGESALLQAGHEKYERRLRYRKVSEEEMLEHANYMVRVPGEEPLYMYHKAWKKQEGLIKEATLKKDKPSLEVHWTDDKIDQPSNPVQYQFLFNRLAIEGSLDTHQHQLLSKPGNLKQIQIGVKEKTVYKDMLHSPPMSERGTLRIENARPEDVMQYLQKRDLASGYTPLVPYSLFYQGTNRKGRVLPLQDDYLTGACRLNIPSNHAVIHGMTGVSTPSQAINRLKLVHQYGGLKSITERTRLGIGKVSMSPKGDIASGIDHGVPTKIGPSPSYGGHIYFIMKPRILHQRDAWFSNIDFGGGHDRYDHYNTYAKGIGQGKMHHVASHDARQKHIESGLGNTNEAYLKYEINWEDVDTICADQSCASSVKNLVAKWQEAGSLPSHIQVTPFKFACSTMTIGPIAERLNKEYHKEH
jgi:hypothetical protein